VRESNYRAPRIVASSEGWRLWLRYALLLLGILCLAGLAYFQGGSVGGVGLVGLQPDARQQIKELEAERDELRRELAMVKQAADIDRESILSIREKIKQFQDERLKMEEELAFLRGIVSTGSKKKTLRVQNFRLEPGLEAGQYVYKFSVTQIINSGLIAKGKIDINVEGLQDGRTRIVDLSELSDDKASSIKMRFRYFQNIEGKLSIPDGFEPATINIEVKPSGKKLESVKESYNWSPFS
jgi:cell division protein FtsB